MSDASDRLRDDRDFVLAAIEQQPMVFAYASYRLANDRDVVLKAVKMCDSAHYALYEASRHRSGR